MTILEEIVRHKREEVALNKSLRPVKLLERSIYFETPVVSMKTYLKRRDKVGIIAEIKRKAPSTGILKQQVDVEQLSIGYMQAGATALSVLTDEVYFGGSAADLTVARKFNYCPILRKDFIVDAYQLVEAKSIGADCILLIAAALAPGECRDLANTARGLGLEVLLEIHSKNELLEYVSEAIDIVGVNNRNLNDFSTSLETSHQLAALIPAEFAKISESGITHAQQVADLKQSGFDGFLIGGHFMRQAQPAAACGQLIRDVQKLLP